MEKNQINLREIYQNLEQTKNTKLHQTQENIDSKVCSAYGIKNNEDSLKLLFELNLEVAKQETNNQSVIAPGMPLFITKNSQLIMVNRLNLKSSSGKTFSLFRS